MLTIYRSILIKQTIIFHPYNKPMKQQITIKIHKKAIDEKESIKYLGVLIDFKLETSYSKYI